MIGTATTNAAQNSAYNAGNRSAPSPIAAVQPFLSQDLFVLLMTLSLLTLGSDELAVQVGGMTLKIVFPLLMAAFAALYIRRSKAITFDLTLGILFSLWAMAGLASTFQSYQPVKSLGYTTWILFNFFVIIGLCYNLAREYGPKVALAVWFLVFRIHAFLIFAEIAFKIVSRNFSRPSLWFYEPSYLAIFMTAYFAAALYMFLRQPRTYRLDFFLATTSMLAITSATGMLGLIFAVLLNFVIARQRIKLLIWSSVAVAAFLGILYAFFQGTPYYNLIAGFLFEGGDLLQVLLLRGGNRVVRAMIGWQAFHQHPWLGIGIGADSAYMDQSAIPDQAMQYVRKFINVSEGQPFSNIFIEVLGTTGIIGFIPFAGILFFSGYKLVSNIHKKDQAEAIAFLIGFFSILVALQVESTVLRYYLWSPLGLALGVIAHRRIAPPDEALQHPVPTKEIYG